MKRLWALLLTAALSLTLLVPGASAAYTDVPAGSALAGEVQKAVDYGLMNGYSASSFGYSDSMTRAQFVTVLDRMLLQPRIGSDENLVLHISTAMEVDSPLKNTANSVSWTYFHAIDHAVQFDVVDTDVAFRSNDPITRGEMAEMLVRALGLKSAAAEAEKENSLPFTDVTERAGYISVAYDIGMTNGTSATTFGPDNTATRAQAAAMLVRIYEKLHQETDFTHGFYAISSYSQLDWGTVMDAVSAGWSRMVWDGETALLSTTSANGNEFCIPSGYDEVVDTLNDAGTALNLNVFMDTSGGVASLLSSAEGRTQAVEQIVNELTVTYNTIGRNPYAGVTIDFEGLRSGQKASFTAFLTELSREVKALDKSLYVCVSPYLTTGSYYDGYDYAAIASLADKVILMAYDYDAKDMSAFVGTEYYKTAAPAPIDQVYWSLREIAGQVGDTSKVVLGLSRKNVAWQIDENDKLVSGTPVYLDNDTLHARLEQSGTQRGWSDSYQTNYAIYTTEDGSRYFVWYDGSASAQVKADTAKLLGIAGISIWRLGTFPVYTTDNWGDLLG